MADIVPSRRHGWLRGLMARHLRRLHNRTDLTLVPTGNLARELAADGYRNLDVLARGVEYEPVQSAEKIAAEPARRPHRWIGNTSTIALPRSCRWS